MHVDKPLTSVGSIVMVTPLAALVALTVRVLVVPQLLVQEAGAVGVAVGPGVGAGVATGVGVGLGVVGAEVATGVGSGAGVQPVLYSYAPMSILPSLRAQPSLSPVRLLANPAFRARLDA